MRRSRALKADIAAKGIRFFAEIDQSEAGRRRRHQAAPLDPARVRQPAAGHAVHHRQRRRRPRLAGAPAGTQDDAGQVWAVYTDFNWIARRHGITNRDEQFRTASGVIGRSPRQCARQP